MYYWIACTKDEYELPVYVEDSCTSLAKKLGVVHSCLTNCIKQNRGTKEYNIKRVERDYEDN